MSPQTNLTSKDVVKGLIEEEAKEVKSALYDKEIEYIVLERIVDSLDQNRLQRIKYAHRTFILTCAWISVMLLMVLLSSVTFNGQKILQLSDKVIITLITTTTVNVFAFFLLVMQFLFNKHEMTAIEFIITGKKSAYNTEKSTPPTKTSTSRRTKTKSPDQE